MDWTNPVTAYFNQDDLDGLVNKEIDLLAPSGALQQAHAKLVRLQQAIHNQLHMQNIDLHVQDDSAPVHVNSACTHKDGGSLLIQYMRPHDQAVTVERLMGREEVGRGEPVEPRRHPVVELRLHPEGFAVELVLSPDAWWDQQNIMGKLSISRHRRNFYETLKGLDKAYCMGFWRGLHLSDMHIKAELFPIPRVMDEWLSTFEPGTDWFRVGKWYAIDDDALQQTTVQDEILKQIKLLNQIYAHVAWASDNNFRDFYQRSGKKR